jgi:hypothetical protein
MNMQNQREYRAYLLSSQPWVLELSARLAASGRYLHYIVIIMMDGCILDILEKLRWRICIYVILYCIGIFYLLVGWCVGWLVGCSEGAIGVGLVFDILYVYGRSREGKEERGPP